MGERHPTLIHPSSLMQAQEEHRGKQAAINPLHPIHLSSLMQVEEEHRGKQAAINPLRLIRLSSPT